MGLRAPCSGCGGTWSFELGALVLRFWRRSEYLKAVAPDIQRAKLVATHIGSKVGPLWDSLIGF